jgi:hypothetical protein
MLKRATIPNEVDTLTVPPGRGFIWPFSPRICCTLLRVEVSRRVVDKGLGSCTPSDRFSA